MSSADAQQGIYIPLFSYRTGPFAGSGIPIANGMHDYLEMLNERDGGIGGVKIAVEECETGYKNDKGVECYEALKGKKPVVVNPYSTGITLALIPKASVDHIPVLSMAYGFNAVLALTRERLVALSAATDAEVPGVVGIVARLIRVVACGSGAQAPSIHRVPSRSSTMTLCPIALAIGCQKCPAFKICPLKSSIGDYRPPEPKPPESKPSAGKSRSKRGR